MDEKEITGKKCARYFEVKFELLKRRLNPSQITSGRRFFESLVKRAKSKIDKKEVRD
jgi:hypothetical protein